jgi:hypothetical protein
MVAGVVRALGVDLGNVGKRKNSEDADFQSHDLEQMRAAIARRDSERDVWGWKFPGAGTYLPGLLKSIRNPYLVVVFRDPVATALGQVNLDRESSRRPPRISLHESNANTATNMGLVLAMGRPCLLVSHERAKEYPSELVDEIADFLQVQRADDDLRKRLLDYVSPGQYKLFENFFEPTVERQGNG